MRVFCNSESTGHGVQVPLGRGHKIGHLCKSVQIFISQPSLIREHSYLEHGYLGGFSTLPKILVPVCKPQGGSAGQNLGQQCKSDQMFL